MTNPSPSIIGLARSYAPKKLFDQRPGARGVISVRQMGTPSIMPISLRQAIPAKVQQKTLPDFLSGQPAVVLPATRRTHDHWVTRVVSALWGTSVHVPIQEQGAFSRARSIDSLLSIIVPAAWHIRPLKLPSVEFLGRPVSDDLFSQHLG
jgi:hypothetical protein